MNNNLKKFTYYKIKSNYKTKKLVYSLKKNLINLKFTK